MSTSAKNKAMLNRNESFGFWTLGLLLLPLIACSDTGGPPVSQADTGVVQQFDGAVSELSIADSSLVDSGKPPALDAAPVEVKKNGTYKDIVYAQVGGVALKGDLYLAQKREGLLILVHGGAFVSGTKTTMSGIAQYLLPKGYASFSVDYRVNKQGGAFPALPQDILCAIAFARDHAQEYGYPPEKIAILGTSAGGALVSIVGAMSNMESYRPSCAGQTDLSVVGVIPGFGLHDWLERENQGEIATSEAAYLGGSFADHPENYTEASPVTHVNSITAPYLLFHGSVDEAIPYHQSELMHEALQKAGKSSELLIVDGAGHSFVFKPSDYKDQALAAIEAFLAKVFL